MLYWQAGMCAWLRVCEKSEGASSPETGFLSEAGFFFLGGRNS